MPPAQPDDLVHAEPGFQLVLDLLAAELRVTVRVEQALLGRDQRALSVDRDRPALEHQARADALDAERSENPLGAGGVLVIGHEALAPGIEAEVHPGATTRVVHDADRPGIAHPGVVDRDLEQLDGGRQQTPGVGRRAGIHHHGERLELDDRVGRGRVFLFRLLEVRPPQFLAWRPGHQAPLVRLPLGGHAPGPVSTFWGRIVHRRVLD